MKRPTRQLLNRRAIQLAAAGAAGAVLAGGGYAIAAGKPSTIHACVDRTSAHLVHVQKKCSRKQTGLTWNQKGLQGVPGRVGATGAAGATGPAGPAAITAWAVIGDGGELTPGGHGIAVSHTGPGAYAITATPAACAQVEDAPVVSIVDSYPVTGVGSAGAFPVAWTDNVVLNRFVIHTGNVVNGQFSPSDHTFNVQVECS